jgi:glycosyltransferase involved in cell wall biosynthesis
MFKILHLITTLDTGGAEIMLLRLLSRMNSTRFSHSVISMTSAGEIGKEIRKLGTPVYNLGFSLGKPSLTGLKKLIRLLRITRPDILQTWMYHANILGSFGSFFAGKIPVIWNIQASTRKLEEYKPMTALMVGIGGGLSRLTQGIIFNSMNGKEGHERIGYFSKQNLFIPNGFDLDLFRPDDRSKKEVKEALSIPLSLPCIGLFARFHPVKGHLIFLEAARSILDSQIDAHFILCGEGCDEKNKILQGWIQKLKLIKSVQLLGRRTDMPRIMASMDLVVSSSLSEGFSNVIGEAMACGVPCVVTDVGDSSLIVGDTGEVIPPHDSNALAQGIIKILGIPCKERSILGQKARARIQDHFSIQTVAARYEAFYETILSRSTRERGKS